MNINFLLAQLSWKLKWAFLIACRQFVRLSVLKLFIFFIFFSRITGPVSTKLGAKHPWVKGIQVCSNEGPHSFPRGNNYKICKNTFMKFKNLLLQNYWATFNQTWHKASLGEGDYSLFKWRTIQFSQGK